MPKLPKSVQRKVAKRANICCEYCKLLSSFSPAGLTVDHIYHVSLGGTDTLANLAWCCRSCNEHKHTAIQCTDPETDSLVLLFHPRKDKWDFHFKWDSDFSKIKGLTPTGRATIIRLKMNNDAIVNLRKVILGFGRPPN